MKRLIPWALLFLGACGADTIPEIPTLSVGDGGAHFVTDARTPFEAYDKARSELSKAHLNIRRNLGPNGNRVGLESAAARIVRNLEIMRSVLVHPAPATLDPYIAFYKEVLTLAQQNRLGGHWITQIDQKENGLHVTYHPNNVEILSAFESKEEPKAKEAPSEKKSNDLPPPVEHKEDPSLPKKETPTEPEPVAKDEGASYRLMYKAWQKSHTDLCAAFRDRKEVRERFEELREALRELGKRLPTAQADRLQIYVSFYEKIHEDTKGFTVLPEGAKDEDVLNDLKIAAAGIEKDFDPHRKK